MMCAGLDRDQVAGMLDRDGAVKMGGAIEESRFPRVRGSDVRPLARRRAVADALERGGSRLDQG